MKHQEWGLWQEVVVFILNVFILKNGMAKIKEKRKRRRYAFVLILFQAALNFPKYIEPVSKGEGT